MRRWKDKVAAGTIAPDPSALPELLGFLASPDPVRRDAIAFTLLEKWIIAGDVPVAELRSIRDTLVDRLRTGDTVFARSFAALTLGAIVKRDLIAPYLTDDERRTVLDAVAAFIVRRHGFNLHDGEDGRLAQAVLAAVRAGVASDKLAAFIAQVRAPLDQLGFDPVLFAAQRNARNLLFTLYVQTSLAAPRTQADTDVLIAVTAALRASARCRAGRASSRARYSATAGLGDSDLTRAM